MCQLCVTEILHCDWSVAGRLMRQMSLTRTHHATVVGPIRIGPTTVAFVKSTDDDRLWCAHTMRQSSFRRLCVQQKTKIAWCVPGFRIPVLQYQFIKVRLRYINVPRAPWNLREFTRFSCQLVPLGRATFWMVKLVNFHHCPCDIEVP